MPRRKKDLPTQESKVKADLEIEESKTSIQGYKGGLDIDLDRKMSDGQVLRDVLSKHVQETLELELQNQESFVRNLSKWQKLYQGKRDPKSFPHEKAANVAVPLTRIMVDTIVSRIMGWLFGKRKIWIVRALQPDYVGLDRKIEDAFDDFQRNVLKLREKLISPLLQTVKMGAGIGKLIYEDKKKTVYVYATEDELKDPGITKYDSGKGKTKLVKQKISTYKGPNFYPVSLEDFVMSSDAIDIQDAYLSGFKITLRKAELDLRARQGLYYQDAVDKVTSSDRIDETKESRVENQDKELKKTQYEEPYEIWELNIKYDVDEDGEEDDLVIIMHRSSGAMLKAIYNPIFNSFRPFVKLVGSPIEYSWRGEGVCEILQVIQEEADTMHNQRLDRISIINAPPTLTRRGVDLDNFKLYPGKNYVTDESDLEGVLRVVQIPDIYPSTEREEDRLVSYAYKACGVSPESTGQPTAERPVARETLARLEETNKKFKMIIDNILLGITELGYMLLEFFAQYQPTYTYSERVGEEFTEKTVQFPTEYIRNCFEVSLQASSDIMSQEMRREVLLTCYQLLSDFMTKQGGMAQAIVSPQIPSDFKKVLLEANAIGVNLLKRIMEDFDMKDSETLVLDIAKAIDVQKAISTSLDLQPPPPQPPRPGMAGIPAGGMPPGGEMSQGGVQ